MLPSRQRHTTNKYSPYSVGTYNRLLPMRQRQQQRDVYTLNLRFMSALLDDSAKLMLWTLLVRQSHRPGHQMNAFNPLT